MRGGVLYRGHAGLAAEQAVRSAMLVPAGASSTEVSHSRLAATAPKPRLVSVLLDLVGMNDLLAIDDTELRPAAQHSRH